MSNISTNEELEKRISALEQILLNEKYISQQQNGEERRAKSEGDFHKSERTGGININSELFEKANRAIIIFDVQNNGEDFIIKDINPLVKNLKT